MEVGTDPSSGLEGIFSEIDETESAESPTPSAEEAVVEEVEQAEPEQVEEAVEPEEELQVVLPKEQAKQYSKALMAHYAKRLGADPESLEGNQPLQKAVKQLIDSAIYAGQLEGKIPKEEAATEVAPKVEIKTPASIEEQFKALEEEVSGYNDPAVMDALVQRLEAANDTKTQLSILSMAVANQVRTMLEKNGHALLDKNPNLNGFVAERQQRVNYENHANAYDEAVKASGVELPEFASPEYVSLANDTLKSHPFLNNPGLTPKERMAAFVALVQGKKADPAVVEKAVATGKAQGAKAANAVLNGKLGAGQSKGTIAPKVTGNDDIFGKPDEVRMNQRLVGK